MMVAACSGGEVSEQPVTLSSMTTPSPDACDAGQLECSGVCTDVSGDARNCGECGHDCGMGTCDAGRCACSGTLQACAAGCVDTLTDDQNCGSCGTVCGDSTRCQRGKCTPLSEICEPACAPSQLCVNNACSCAEATEFCGGACVDPKTTPQHCGGCDDACNAGYLCTDAKCACPSGQTECGGKECADLQLSEQHCGACEVACEEGEACMAGNCLAPLGADGCGGAPTDLALKEVAAYQSIKIPLSQGVTLIDAAARVPLIQGRPTLFRVFVKPNEGYQPRELSARVTVKNGERVDQYFAKQMIMGESSDAETASTFQISVPRARIQADTRYSVEVVECKNESATAAAATSTNPNTRLPAEGDTPLAAADTGILKITLIPMNANMHAPDLGEAALKTYREYLEAMYPVDTVQLTVGKPLDIPFPIDWDATLEQLRSQRQADRPAAEVYYFGLIKPTDTLREYCMRGCTAGVAFVGNVNQAGTRVGLGLAYADELSAGIIAHEVGHNHGRGHAPCAPGDQIQGVDQRYPYEGGAIGTWGYDFRKKTFFNPDETKDIMGYCEPKWVSDYSYRGLLDRSDAINVQSLSFPDPQLIQNYRVMLVNADGPRWSHPFPEPAEPFGTPEQADVLDIDGQAIDTVTVYRTRIGDSQASTVLVPAPVEGWNAIKVVDALPLSFSAPISIPAPR